jgi:hypothetical protein
MNMRRAALVAAFLWPAAAAPAVAQSQSASAQNEPPCIKEFTALRSDAEKKAAAIKAAGQRKASPKEACHLFSVFSAAEAKMVKYADENAVWCGIPKQVVDSMKTSHDRTTQIRTKVCRVAAAPPRPRGPSLSESLGVRTPDSDNIKTGRGTFDTLTGSPIGK